MWRGVVCRLGRLCCYVHKGEEIKTEANEQRSHTLRSVWFLDICLLFACLSNHSCSIENRRNQALLSCFVLHDSNSCQAVRTQGTHVVPAFNNFFVSPCPSYANVSWKRRSLGLAGKEVVLVWLALSYRSQIKLLPQRVFLFLATPWQQYYVAFFVSACWGGENILTSTLRMISQGWPRLAGGR